MDSQKVKEREAQVTRLLREAERQTRMDRVDPRRQLEEQMQLVEQDAKARRSMEDMRKAGTRKGLLTRPTKGGMDLRDARKRRLVDLWDSPLVVDRLKAELESRRRLEDRMWKKRRRTTSMETVRW